MSQKIFTVDAFADGPFAGNPAAVCPLKSPRDETWMRKVAREMNLSETAFLHPVEEGFALRWFTPSVEISLCGHATLASAHVLWETHELKRDQTARFQTMSGLLTADFHDEEIELNFPAKPIEPSSAPAGLDEALGTECLYIGRNHLDYLVELDSEETLRELKPDFRRLSEIPVRGVIVTARSSSARFDFVSRFFAPASGANEDPVTGSAHCALGPYWQAKLGKAEFTAYQASARGGMVKVRVRSDRVFLSGKAVTVVRSELADVAL